MNSIYSFTRRLTSAFLSNSGMIAYTDEAYREKIAEAINVLTELCKKNLIDKHIYDITVDLLARKYLELKVKNFIEPDAGSNYVWISPQRGGSLL